MLVCKLISDLPNNLGDLWRPRKVECRPNLGDKYSPRGHGSPGEGAVNPGTLAAQENSEAQGNIVGL